MEISLIITRFTSLFANDYKFEISQSGYYNFFNDKHGRILYYTLGDLKKQGLTGIGCGISIKCLEEIIHPLFKESPHYNIGDTIGLREYSLIFNKNIGEGVYEYLPISLDTEENVEMACSLIYKFINQDAEPFFNYWKDIRDFLPFLETDDSMQIHSYFSGYGMEKKIVIWYLCNHPNFTKFIKDLIDSYIQYLNENPSDPWSKKDFKRLQSLLKRLEAVKPLYEWSDSYLIPKQP
jgi:hypothetical protein